jgi:hypothetical protein
MKKLVDADEPARNNGQLSPDTTPDTRNYCLIDDFEDNDLISPWNTTWYSFNDSKDLGSEAKIRVDAHGALNTKYALQFQYSFKGSLLQNPHCGCGLEIGNFAKTITKYHGIEFCIQSSHPNDSLELVLEVKDVDIGQNVPFQYHLSSSVTHQYIAIPFDKFVLASWWNAPYPLHSPKFDSAHQCFSIYFLKGAESFPDGVFWIDELKFYAGSPAGKVRDDSHTLPAHFTISGSGQPSKESNASLTVDINTPFKAPESHNGGRISSELYGLGWALFVEPPPTDKMLPHNLKVIRAGGDIMSRYNWRTNKYTFCGQTTPQSKTSLDEFIAACHSFHAEPVIQVNAMGYAPNPNNQDRMENCMTANDAADLVTYLNGQKHLRVKYFEIDNEFELWHESHQDVWGKKPCSAAEYLNRFITCAYAMKKAQAAISSPNDIQIIGPEACTSWLDYKTYVPDDNYGGFDCFIPYFLNECRKFETDKVRNPHGYRVLDILGFHYYPLFRTNFADPNSFIPEGVPKMLESSQTWWNPRYLNHYDQNVPKGQVAQVIPRFNQWINKYYPGTKLAITEWGVDPGMYIHYDPVVRPLYEADIYGIAAKYGVDYLMPVLINEFIPEIYTLQLFSRNFKGTVLSASSDRDDLLSVYACDDGDGNLVLEVINKDGGKDYHAKIQLQGYKGKAVNSIFYYTFKKYSLTCLRIPKDPAKTQGEVWEYGAEQI